uniref:Uncharacterized protein n=1 Tax=Rhizophora mucronata TaxID=61149 RepID=A0A2P2PV29_RHIMU
MRQQMLHWCGMPNIKGEVLMIIFSQKGKHKLSYFALLNIQ